MVPTLGSMTLEKACGCDRT